jgi:hypothetical protein
MISLSLLVLGIINLLWISSWTRRILNELTPRAFEEPPAHPASRFPSLATVLLGVSLIQLVAIAGHGIPGNPYDRLPQRTDGSDLLFSITFVLVIAFVTLLCRAFFQFGKVAYLYEFKQSSLIYKYGMEAFEKDITPEKREAILARRGR